MNNVLNAFGLTLFAGLCTGIGSILALITKKTNTKFLSLSLGFSAGVMIYVSMIELISDARNILIKELGLKPGYYISTAAFFLGILFIAIIDKSIPKAENPHEIYKVEDIDNKNSHADIKLLRMGLLTALAVGIHNFPEGLATFISALQEPSIALPITAAIAIHNIPEGIAISVPVYHATGDKRKAFMYSFLSGLSEPIGAIIGYLILMPFMSDIVLGFIFAFIAGIMVFVSLDELLPSAREYGEHHLSVYGLVSGMAVMAISLLMFI